MRGILRLIFAIPRAILSFIWHFFWGLVRTLVLIGLVGAALFWYANHSQSPLAQNVRDLFTEASQGYSAQKNLGQNLQDIATDTADNHQEGARWSTNSASVYLASTDPTFVAAYEAALEAWNNTGAFTFRRVDNEAGADIILTDHSDGTSQAAGQTKTSIRALTKRIDHADVYLNRYYLLNESYGYSQERITNTAEHELGHAIGLDHNDQETSVMQSAGSYYGIQPLDIEAVNNLYSK